MSHLLIKSRDELHILPNDTPLREEPNGVLLATPEYFDVEYEINVHMKGNVGNVDRKKAQEQWHTMKRTYESLGVPMDIITSAPGLPDQVFPANLAVIAKRHGHPLVIPSRMASPRRQPEVAFVISWARKKGYDIEKLPDQPNIVMEGMGDFLWHPSRELLYVGFGHRTTDEGIQAVQNILDVPMVLLELVDPAWYHLDTAFSPLNETTALVVAQAFTKDGLKLLSTCFENIIDVPLDEAMNFAANGFTPDGKHYLMHKGSPETKRNIEATGFQVIELDISEFLKSGGSVFCMKLRVFL